MRNVVWCYVRRHLGPTTEVGARSLTAWGASGRPAWDSTNCLRAASSWKVTELAALLPFAAASAWSISRHIQTPRWPPSRRWDRHFNRTTCEGTAGTTFDRFLRTMNASGETLWGEVAEAVVAAGGVAGVGGEVSGAETRSGKALSPPPQSPLARDASTCGAKQDEGWLGVERLQVRKM